MLNPGGIQRAQYLNKFPITTLSHLLLYATISFGECWHVIFLGSVLPSMAQKHWSIFTMAGIGLGVGDPLFRK